ncbi:MAG TPA: hypothetical protein VJ836_02495 [Candidatus Saccharimonadales bacterium]|nr:hypothetical protein [Candidatus Saccharimonadales bacterium]
MKKLFLVLLRTTLSTNIRKFIIFSMAIVVAGVFGLQAVFTDPKNTPLNTHTPNKTEASAHTSIQGPARANVRQAHPAEEPADSQSESQAATPADTPQKQPVIPSPKPELSAIAFRLVGPAPITVKPGGPTERYAINTSDNSAVSWRVPPQTSKWGATQPEDPDTPVVLVVDTPEQTKTSASLTFHLQLRDNLKIEEYGNYEFEIQIEDTARGITSSYVISVQVVAP